MKPKEILEKEKIGYIELSDDQIEEYICYDYDSGCVYFTYDYEINRQQKETLNFELKVVCDYDIEIIRSNFGLTKENKYTLISDKYYLNDDLKVFFKESELLTKNNIHKKIIKEIKNKLKNVK